MCHCGVQLSGRHQHPLLDPFRPVFRRLWGVAGRGALPPRKKRRHRLEGQPRAQLDIVQRAPDQLVGQGAGGAPLGRVVGVHVAVDLSEAQVGGERAGAVGGAGGDRQCAVGQRLQLPLQPREVELVDQTGAPGLQQHRKVVEVRNGGHEFLGLQAAHPQRQAGVESLPRHQQGASGGLAEAGAEQPRRFQGRPQQRLQVVRGHQSQSLIRVHRLPAEDGDRIVGGVNLRLHPVSMQGGAQGQRPGPVEPSAPEAVDHQLLEVLGAPVAPGPRQHPLHHQVATVGQRGAGDFPLALQVPRKLLCGAVVEAQGGYQLALQRLRPRRQPLFRMFQEAGDALREVHAAAPALGPPEGWGRCRLGRGADQHVVVGDPVDLPVLGAQGEDLTHLGLPDELLVQLADHRTRLRVTDVEVAAVRDDAAGAVQREHGAVLGLHLLADAIVADARLQLADAGAGVAAVAAVAAGEHLHHQVELGPGQVLVGAAASQELEQLVHGPRLGGGHGHDDLGQHVQRIGQGHERLDVPCPHRLGQGGGADEVLGEDGKDHPSADFSHPMAGAADALQGGGDGGRRLDQHHLIQIADVDAHLQGTGGDDGLELAALQPRLHLQPDFAGERAVVGIGQGRRLIPIDGEGELFCQPAAVGEEQGGGVGVDDVPERRRQRLPDLLTTVGGAPRRFRKADGQVDGLVTPGFHHLHGTPHPALVATRHIRRHPVEGLHRGRQGDALKLPAKPHQPFQGGEHQGAPAVVDQGVHLVEDDRGHAAQHVPAPGAGEQQGKALRRGDEDLRRPAQHALAVALRGVSRPRCHPQLGHGAAGGEGGQGAEQVALDIVVERLQRRHVEHPGGASLPPSRCELVQRPEEGGEGLAGAGGRRHQHVLAGRDDRPGPSLSPGGRGERGAEPVRNAGLEQCQRRTGSGRGLAHRLLPGTWRRIVAHGPGPENRVTRLPGDYNRPSPAALEGR